MNSLLTNLRINTQSAHNADNNSVDNVNRWGVVDESVIACYANNTARRRT